jgi:hypothetical protein
VITVLRTVNVAVAVNRPASGALTGSVIVPPGATVALPKVNVFDCGADGVPDGGVGAGG